MKRLSRSVYTPISILNKNLLTRLRGDDPSLVRIVFSSRNLGSQGVNILTQALLANTNLQELDLSSNSIGEGVHFISSLLTYQAANMIAPGVDSEERGGIRTLKLCDNNMRDIGVKALAFALESNVMLEDLWLDDNFIGASALALLASAIQRNSKLKRLHLRHNSFQSLYPLIMCTFDKRSLNSVADSNHTLQHIFLNCGYSYENERLEATLKINRMGKVEARRKKIAIFLEEDLGRLLQMDFDPKLLPRLIGILAQHSNISTIFRVMSCLSSEALVFRGRSERKLYFAEDPMDVDEPMGIGI